MQRLNPGKKPRPQIGTTRAYEFSAIRGRERASTDLDPYGAAMPAQAQFKMKRFQDVKSKIENGKDSAASRNVPLSANLISKSIP